MQHYKCQGPIFSFVPLHHYPKGKLASGAPPKGSPEDGPGMPDGAFNQYLNWPDAMKRETSETCMFLTRLELGVLPSW
jgi:hypothetical protein